jgi:hypothetical protein
MSDLSPQSVAKQTFDHVRSVGSRLTILEGSAYIPDGTLEMPPAGKSAGSLNMMSTTWVGVLTSERLLSIRRHIALGTPGWPGTFLLAGTHRRFPYL